MGDKFKLKPGQIDYSKARWAPVINCVVQYEETENFKLLPGFDKVVKALFDEKEF